MSEPHQEPNDLPTAALPGFARPASDPPDPTWTTDPAPEAEASPDAAGGPGRPVESDPSGQSSGLTRTSTTSSDSASPAEVARLVAGFLGLAYAGASWLLRRARRKVLRPPTQAELLSVARPVGAILGRHSPAAQIESEAARDLVDATKAVAGVVAYLQTEPVQPLQADYVQAAPEPAA